MATEETTSPPPLPEPRKRATIEAIIESARLKFGTLYDDQLRTLRIIREKMPEMTPWPETHDGAVAVQTLLAARAAQHEEHEAHVAYETQEREETKKLLTQLGVVRPKGQAATLSEDERRAYG